MIFATAEQGTGPISWAKAEHCTDVIGDGKAEHGDKMRRNSIEKKRRAME